MAHQHRARGGLPLSPQQLQRFFCTFHRQKECLAQAIFCLCWYPDHGRLSWHNLYLKEQYALSAGLAEGALAMGASAYPIPAIYLHLVAVMDYVSLKQTKQACNHLLEAWNLARPDDLIEAFGEHHGLLGGMLEAVIKPQWPKDFERIIQITYQFSAGWRKIHNPDTGDTVADNLSTTEFAIAMLAARGWTNQEIADYMGLSHNTVKRYISNAMTALGIERRQDLKNFMLH